MTPAVAVALVTGMTVVMSGISTRSSFAADITEITPEDYFGATYYRQALEHPQIQKARSEDRRVGLVARDIGWKKRNLLASIKKVAALGGDPLELAKAGLETEFASSRARGRILATLMSDEEPKHVVLYVRFQAERAEDVVKDAAAIAAVVARAAPFVSTLSLAAIAPRADVTSKTAFWSAKISRGSMARIQERRIEDYAERLYAGLFEGTTPAEAR
ncbi:MAG: hypothetical protein H6729_12695 [Deltaproteobacteria bacterium]|nr:hypothetical protein [Deltaproteobacteria bacterium]